MDCLYAPLGLGFNLRLLPLGRHFQGPPGGRLGSTEPHLWPPCLPLAWGLTFQVHTLS